MKTVIFLILTNVIITVTVAQTTAFEKLQAFEKNEYTVMFKDTNNTKYMNTLVDTLKSLHNQCSKIYEMQIKDANFYTTSNIKVLQYKYMALRYLGKIASQSFFKDKKKAFDYLSSKFKDEAKDIAYSRTNDFGDFSEKLRLEIGRYNYRTILIAYLLGDMKKQLPLALAIDTAYAGSDKAEQSLLAIIVIDGLIKNNKPEGLDKRIDYRVTGYYFNNSMIAYDDKLLILSELVKMLTNNQTPLSKIDKTGAMSKRFAQLMFDHRFYKYACEMFTDAADAGNGLPGSRIDALNSSRIAKMDNATIINLIDNLKELDKKMPIGNAGWNVIAYTYNYLGDKVAAEEAKKNIK